MCNDTSSRRTFLGSLTCGAIGLTVPAFAAQRPQPGNNLTLAINEAATGPVSFAELVQRYDPLAKILAAAAGRGVSTRPIVDIRMFEDELARQPEFIFAKTVDILATEVEAMRYKPIVKMKKPYVAGILLSEKSQAKSLSDLIGTDVLLPPPRTMTSKLAMAAFREAGIGVAVMDAQAKFPTSIKDMVTVRHVQFQEIIPSTLEKNWWYQAGVVNPSMLSKWKGKVLMRFKPQPNWSVAAHADVSDAALKAAASSLIAMSQTPDGKTALDAMKIDEFVEATRTEYLDLARYVK